MVLRRRWFLAFAVAVLVAAPAAVLHGQQKVDVLRIGASGSLTGDAAVDYHQRQLEWAWVDGCQQLAGLYHLPFLEQHSVANVQGLSSLPTVRLERRLGTLPDATMVQIKRALAFALDLRTEA